MAALPRVRLVVGLAVLALAAGYLVRVVDGRALIEVAGAVLADPLGLCAALAGYAAAFALRSWAWRVTLPGLGFGQSWAALHVSLLGNHVLPLRLGEVLRVTSVLRRTSLTPRPVIASAVTLRAADLLGVLAMAVLAVPDLVAELVGLWWWVAVAGVAVVAALGAGWSWRLGRSDGSVRLPTLPIGLAVLLAWVLESVVILQVARLAGYPLGLAEAVAVTAVTIVVQAVAVAPGGLGSYEAAATAALVALGMLAGPAFAIALTTHAVKTGYSLVVGVVALLAPDPTFWGRLRLPRRLPERPPRAPVPADAPVVAFLPVHDEEAAADAEVVHDYNYAQVLTLDLLAKGYRYAEVPISYSFRDNGTSFVRLGRYLRKVVPAVHRELNADRPTRPDTADVPA